MILDIVRLYDYNYTDMICRKDLGCYGIYVLPRSREEMGDF